MKATVQHICMADDDEDDHYFFSTALKEVDSSVLLNCFNSCEKLCRFLTSTTHLPDIIVLDMNMPGNDGQKCLIDLKKEATLLHIPVIIFSTGCSTYSIEEAFKNGATAYIKKPNSIKELKQIITGLLSHNYKVIE